MQMLIDANIYHFLDPYKENNLFLKNFKKYFKRTYRLAASPLWKLWDCLVFWLISIHI